MKPRSNGAVQVDDVGGIKEFLHFDETGEKFAHEMLQDIQPHLEYVKDKQMITGGKNAAGDFYHAGRFPDVIVYAWLNKRGLKMSDLKDHVIEDFLNDPENKPFRIWEGVV
jgi:hypothetical protein